MATQSDGVKFDVTDLTVDYKKLQFSQVATPAIIRTGKYGGKVLVGVKDGRYPVTINNTTTISCRELVIASQYNCYLCKP